MGRREIDRRRIGLNIIARARSRESKSRSLFSPILFFYESDGAPVILSAAGAKDLLSVRSAKGLP
jgi:hypothetical protein